MSELAAHLFSNAASEQPTVCPAVTAATGYALRWAEASVMCGLQGPALAQSLELEGIAASSDLQPVWEGENMSQCDGGVKTMSLSPWPSGCRASVAVGRCLGAQL